jgi:hypothetical protein
MFALTPGHFASANFPSTLDNLRQPFFYWIEMIEVFYGTDRMMRAIDLVEVDYQNVEDPGRWINLDPPEVQFEFFNKVFEGSNQ